jgi:hypothetical protein
MTKEEKVKAVEQWAEAAKSLCTLMITFFTPPTHEQQMRYLATCSDDEVEGIYRWGSKRGKRLAKIECLKRGIIKKSLFERAKEYINKLKK